MLNANHEYWMHIALEEAENALAGELPIGGVLVSNGQEIGRTQTHVSRRSSMAAHGELFALLDANGKLFSAQHPLVMYTTLEPCLMCVGAMMQCGVDEVVFGMRAVPDGGTRYADAISKGGQTPPKVTTGVLENECVEIMRKLPAVHPNHLAINYVYAMLAAYKD
jgi:tRNA(adenine34) deaminase